MILHLIMPNPDLLKGPSQVSVRFCLLKEPEWLFTSQLTKRGPLIWSSQPLLLGNLFVLPTISQSNMIGEPNPNQQ